MRTRGDSLRNVLLLCEAYGGGVKTYIDAITSNKEQFTHIHLHVLVSSTRVAGAVPRGYLVDDQLSFGASPLKFIKAFSALRRVVKQEKIDVIHANSTFSGVLLAVYQRLYRRKVSGIYTPHGYYSFKQMHPVKRALVRFVERRINAYCEKVIHVSTSEEQEALAHRLVVPHKSVVIFNGVEEPSALEKRAQEKFTVVNLARVDEQKNPTEFLSLAQYILERHPNTQFIWAGYGKDFDAMRQRTKELARETDIQFIGHIDNPEVLFSHADLYLSTSHYEGLPFSVIEAMAHKIPLLLSNNVGHQDLVADGKNGLLFQLGDYEAVGDFFESMLHNASKKEALSRHSYELFQEKFSIDPMLKQIEAVYTTT